jgi:hypothetical protein
MGPGIAGQYLYSARFVDIILLVLRRVKMLRYVIRYTYNVSYLKRLGEP